MSQKLQGTTRHFLELVLASSARMKEVRASISRVGLCEVEVDSNFCVLPSTLLPEPSRYKGFKLMNLNGLLLQSLKGSLWNSPCIPGEMSNGGQRS